MQLTRGQRRWLLLGLILLGYGLRVYHIDHFSFWLDEGLTPERSSYSLAKILANEIDIQGVVTKDTHPPLFYLVAKVGRMLLGTSDFAFRYVPLLFSVLTIPTLFVFGRKLHNPRFGLIAALLFTINPLSIWYAQEARMYSLLIWLTLLMTFVLLKAWQKAPQPPTVRTLIGYVALAFLVFATHYVGAFIILGQMALWLYLLWRSKQTKLIAGLVLGGLAIALPFAPTVWARLTDGAIEAGYSYIAAWIPFVDIGARVWVRPNRRPLANSHTGRRPTRRHPFNGRRGV